MDNIIVAFLSNDSAQKIRNVLKENGYQVLGVCTTGAQVIELANRHDKGGVIISGLKLNDMLATDMLDVLSENYELLLLLTSNQVDLEVSNGVSSLTLPLNRLDFVETVNMLLKTSGSENRMRSKNKKAEQERKPERSPEDKEIVEKAKAVLMERNNFTEMQAHRFIQKKSMDTGKKMVETARIILGL